MTTSIAGLRQVAPEVFYGNGEFRAADAAVVELLKVRAAESAKRRCRLCFHAGPDASQQEMLIVMHHSSYVRPHRHFGKVETLAVFEGRCEALVFDEAGAVTERVPMGPASEGGAFFYRMPPERFHTLIFRSEWLVFAETTIGPFDPARSEGAPWAPAENDPGAGHAWLAALPG